MVALPFGAVEAGMKQGRLAFSWKIMRSWLQPPPPPANSPLDGMVLNLALSVVAPRFMAESGAGQMRRKVTVDAAIPDLFSNFPQPQPQPAPTPVPSPAPVRVAAPVQTVPSLPAFAPVSAPVAKPLEPVAARIAASVPTSLGEDIQLTDADLAADLPTFKGAASPGTEFLKRYATPNEIVAKAMALGNIGGALIALPDGLLVAGRIPPGMNSETVAAFVPQIYSRVSQSTRELRMGDLTNLTFSVGKTPWKIFRVGAIYFAAFGRPGEALPEAELAVIAAELDRKAK